jgi:hypothetical protein
MPSHSPHNANEDARKYCFYLGLSAWTRRAVLSTPQLRATFADYGRYIREQLDGAELQQQHVDSLRRKALHSAESARYAVRCGNPNDWAATDRVTGKATLRILGADHAA